MQFVTWEHNGTAEAGVLLGDHVIGLKDAGFSTLQSVIEQGAAALERISHLVKNSPSGSGTALSKVRLLPPLSKPPKMIFIGLNYRDHAIECGAALPQTPVVFSKFNTSIVGPGDAIVLPRLSKQPDYEAELAVVIGKRGKNIPQAQWRDYVFGYTNLHDVSARDVQLATSQWLMGKTFDTFSPLGPAIVTADEIPDPNALKIELILNGEVLQSSNTSEMIFQIPYLIEHLSSVFTLEPGDIISTGTPAGVGMGKTPQRWLRPGDSAVVRIEGIPELWNTVVAE
jgi:2-keto-4-pentenoate hydratase/2-oxohepta-3-ene-1,7-dioic acid hydratase in catechol pathway